MPEPVTAEVGLQAPDFTVSTPLHGSLTLSGFQGKRVVLVFFRTFATGNRFQVAGRRLSTVLCPTCHLMIRDLARNYDQVLALGGEIVAVSTVQLKELQAVLQWGEPRFPICADADAAITRRYGVFSGLWRHPKPAAFLLDRSGVIRYRHVADHQMDLPRGQELVQRLTEL